MEVKICVINVHKSHLLSLTSKLCYEQDLEIQYISVYYYDIIKEYISLK